MSEDSGNRSPKTLADVSHLFFSNSEPAPDVEQESELRPTGPAGEDDAGEEQEADSELGPGANAEDEGADLQGSTRVFVVTGGDGRPGKSTVAANMAQAMTTRGVAALCDADPGIPNARFYLGLPSWNYLSPLTSGGDPADTVLVDSGLLVVDGTIEDRTLLSTDREQQGLSVALPSGESCALDFVVIDSPLDRATGIARAIACPTHFVLVAGPQEEDFFEAYTALATLSRQAGIRSAALVVNRVPSTTYARAFHEKLKLAAERLLSMELLFLGGVVREPNLGALQRERGVMVRSRPDATSALLLREVASNALALREAEAFLAGGPVSPA